MSFALWSRIKERFSRAAARGAEDLSTELRSCAAPFKAAKTAAAEGRYIAALGNAAYGVVRLPFCAASAAHSLVVAAGRFVVAPFACNDLSDTALHGAAYAASCMGLVFVGPAVMAWATPMIPAAGIAGWFGATVAAPGLLARAAGIMLKIGVLGTGALAGLAGFGLGGGLLGLLTGYLVFLPDGSLERAAYVAAKAQADAEAAAEEAAAEGAGGADGFADFISGLGRMAAQQGPAAA